MLVVQYEAGPLLLQVSQNFLVQELGLIARLSFTLIQGPLLLQLLLPRMLGAAARGEDPAQATYAQHQVPLQGGQWVDIIDHWSIIDHFA